MSARGESSKEYLRPGFDRSIMMDFQGAKLSSDTGFILMRELDQRHNVIAPMASALVMLGPARCLGRFSYAEENIKWRSMNMPPLDAQFA